MPIAIGVHFKVGPDVALVVREINTNRRAITIVIKVFNH